MQIKAEEIPKTISLHSTKILRVHSQTTLSLSVRTPQSVRCVVPGGRVYPQASIWLEVLLLKPLPPAYSASGEEGEREEERTRHCREVRACHLQTPSAFFAHLISLSSDQIPT